MKTARLRGCTWVAALTAMACVTQPHESPKASEDLRVAPPAPPSVASTPLGGPGVARPSPKSKLTAGTQVNAKILVISADGTEADLPAITQTLSFLGTPYTVWIGTANPGTLTASVLSNGTQGFYQGIILTTGDLGTNLSTGWGSALQTAEWQALDDYEASFGVREVDWYCYPTTDLGWGTVTNGYDTTDSPIPLQLTTAGVGVFPYVNASGALAIQNVWAYVAPAATGTGITPLLTDTAGNAYAVETVSNGRQVLALSFDSNPYEIHTLTLSYGLVNWVTGGVFIGERHVYMGIQIDDLFLDSDVWNGTATPGDYRLGPSDLDNLVAWQNSKKSNPITANVRVNWAYVGDGTQGTYVPDTLTPEALKQKANFNWISHTWTHPDLDGYTSAETTPEVTQNIAYGKKEKLTGFNPVSLVTPNISGLTTLGVMQSLYANGVRYVDSDTSYAVGWATDNLGIPNALVPGVLEIPRHPTNLYYNVGQPDPWAAEYNSIYESYWGTNLTEPQIVDVESSNVLLYMLRYEIYPWMFHQENVESYDGVHSLLTDLMDAVLTKYLALENLPIQVLTMDQIGSYIQNWMTLSNANITATIVPGVSITLTSPVAVTVPITGVSGPSATTYGGQSITQVSLKPNQPVTLPLN